MEEIRTAYPFTAVVNQNRVKTALLLNAVSSDVGGVLIRGKRGTAKSTLARGLVDLLPEVDVVPGCPFRCDPHDPGSLCRQCRELSLEGPLPSEKAPMRLLTLPLNATEEMVVGTIDIEGALRLGRKEFEPGILAKVNRGVLYVDEVNLLEDHIVDLLLDSAAMGVNIVERESISYEHASRFILVGTMNPEEGDLRPQLEDRFGLCAEVDSDPTPSQRVEILKRSLHFSRDPAGFAERWRHEQYSLGERLARARLLYPSVEADGRILESIALLVDGVGSDGHRAEISILHAARALAALEGAGTVDEGHISRVAALALSHRLRKGPLGVDREEQPDFEALLRDLRLARVIPISSAPAGVLSDPGSALEPTVPTAEGESAGAPTDVKPLPEEFRIPDRGLTGNTAGKRGKPSGTDSRGRYYRSASTREAGPPTGASDIAIDATIRASAARGSVGPGIHPEDVRVKLRKNRCGASVVFVVDASASMGARSRLEASRQAIMSLLLDAYQNRDRVGLIVFKDDRAQLVMNPTSSPALAHRLLANLRSGGTTPLSHGLALACRILQREKKRNPSLSPVLVLISDGGGNVTMGRGDPLDEAMAVADEIKSSGIHSVVIDSAPGASEVSGADGKATAARRIAQVMGGSYYSIRDLTGEAIIEKVAWSTTRLSTIFNRAAPSA